MEILVQLYLMCAECDIPSTSDLSTMARALEENRELFYQGICLSRNSLANFLRALMLTEHRLDDLLFHPPAMRMAEFERYAKDVGIDSQILRRIYLNWQRKYRREVFARG
jgi:hypothetical protein